MNSILSNPIHIVESRASGDLHDWLLIRGGKYRCVLCGGTIPIEPVDSLLLRSGCPKSRAVMDKLNLLGERT